MLKRHQIKVLLKAGHSQVDVAKLAGVSLRSVKRIAKDGDTDHAADASVSTMSPHSGMLRRTPSSALTLQD